MNNKFLSNYTEQTFIGKIRESLSKCKSFNFSVSFIKKAGLILLEKEIEDALNRGVFGRIITSSYQNFTDIPSLETFLSWMSKYPNFSCHFDFQCFSDNGFHTKGYLFQYEKYYEFIVGSTNITRFALLKNHEWNVSLSSEETFSSYEGAVQEFNKIWDRTLLLSSFLVDKYRLLLDYSIEKWDMDYVDLNLNQIKPNLMQRKALKELRRYRDMGVKKSLVIAATGSGKTFLAAFDARNFDARRVLFVVHRDTILHEASLAFQKIFGAKRSYGLYTGEQQNLDADFIFASNIMISTHLDRFEPREFDYIVIDECHHTVASSYKKIINFFEPEFLLGLTATPERMDNEDVFALFDTNVPFELRLRDAILNDLVVPFHYFGIRDKLVDYSFQDTKMISREIAKVENIDFIVKEIEKHRSEGKLKCIAFCNSVSHAMTMAEAFVDSGYHAISLLGENDLGQRLKAFNDLQNEDNPLEIICTVDILNEGVDVPGINMVLFLRPTESSTIFLQQLGRGLRKYPNKEYVTVLDFIGNNYERSAQIAFALGSLGNTVGIEKTYIKQMIASNFASLDIPGVLIELDALSKEEILSNIDKINFNKRIYLENEYSNFKKYLKTERYPSHMDYLNADLAPDLIRLMKAKILNGKNMSYYTFLKKIGEPSIPDFSDDEISFINKVSDLLPLSRVDEFIIITQLLQKDLNIDQLIGFNNRVKRETLTNALHYLNKDRILTKDKLAISTISQEMRDYLLDLIEYGLTKYSIDFGDFVSPFKLYANYYKEQIMKELLEQSSMFMKGTKFDVEKKITYCFVGLKKDKTKEERTNYKDKFLSKQIFQWESENDTTFSNPIGKKLLATKLVHLFVRKVDEEDGITLPFTYFGTGTFQQPRVSFVESLEKDGTIKRRDTILFDIVLDSAVMNELHFDFEIPE